MTAAATIPAALQRTLSTCGTLTATLLLPSLHLVVSPLSPPAFFHSEHLKVKGTNCPSLLFGREKIRKGSLLYGKSENSYKHPNPHAGKNKALTRTWYEGGISNSSVFDSGFWLAPRKVRSPKPGNLHGFISGRSQMRKRGFLFLIIAFAGDQPAHPAKGLSRTLGWSVRDAVSASFHGCNFLEHRQ